MSTECTARANARPFTIAGAKTWHVDPVKTGMMAGLDMPGRSVGATLAGRAPSAPGLTATDSH